MVNRLQLYPGLRVYILKELKKRVNAHYQDKKLDLDMRRGWKELTENRYTMLVKKLQGQYAKQATVFVNEIIYKQHNWYKRWCDLQIEQEMKRSLTPEEHRLLMRTLISTNILATKSVTRKR
ncbi:hypothetical protein BX661DRAFT_92721 [Kickxella alabastrina]|uniref:uncharacterized protein n=1 Tax=Kickxella alabastrina TaxID=61397 RepID=UPI0022206483|nr:uncharacterized protein BX661DRAFT_92721 [Kickxella alabastrina]KAI7819362.1 hypothetical protein BX661DRAFT_92721 [Kickxella alabastrina]